MTKVLSGEIRRVWSDPCVLRAFRESVEYATLEWVDWFDNRRLLEPLDYVAPVEFEAAYYGNIDASGKVAGLV